MEMIDFDPFEQTYGSSNSGIKPTFISIIYGHTTFIRRLKKGDSEESRAIFDHAIRECTLRYVLNKLILFAKNHYIVYNIT